MVEDFTGPFKRAIDIEQNADLLQTEELLKRFGPKKLSQLGLALTNLQVSAVRTGLGGKTMLELVNDPAITSDDISAGSIRVGDIVRMSNMALLSEKKSEKEELEGSILAVVVKIALKTVTLAVDKDVSAADDEDKVLSFFNDSVRVWIVKLTNSITYKRMLSTMNKLQERIDGKNGGLGGNTVVDILLGNTKYSLPEIPKNKKISKYFDSNLNPLQKKAVEFALNSPITIVHGPPGTGKTYTIIEIIKQLSLNQNEKVLVCGPSNISVDTILERLAKVFTNELPHEDESGKSKRKRKAAANSAKFPPEKLIRIGHPARLLATNLDHSLDVLSKGTEILSDIHKDIGDVLGKVKKAKRYAERRALWGELKVLRKELREREKKLTLDLLLGANVVLLTLHGSGSYELTSLYKEQENVASFDTIIIDEVSQALEPQCWIPLINHFGFKRLIIAGDNMQLPPTVKSKDIDLTNKNSTLTKKLLQFKIGDIADLERTLFDRLVEDLNGDAFRILLDTQYRMNEAIMTFPSQEMYDSKLKADPSVAHIDLADLIPNREENEGPLQEISSTLWLDTQGGDFAEKSADSERIVADLSGSKYNEMEVEVCARHVSYLVQEYGIKQEQIGVISPYSAQVSRLKKMLHETHPGVEISTVDGFQGREKEVIILSLVRSNDNREVGFLKDERRLNVAITRPKRHLCVVGDLELMQQSGVAFLRHWADYAEAHYDMEYPQLDDL